MRITLEGTHNEGELLLLSKRSEPIEKMRSQKRWKHGTKINASSVRR